MLKSVKSILHRGFYMCVLLKPRGCPEKGSLLVLITQYSYFQTQLITYYFLILDN